MGEIKKLKHDLTGQRFGRLIAVKAVGRAKSNYILWKCKCDCGRFSTPTNNALQRGAAKSCGCLKREVLKAGMRLSHGLSKTPAYRAAQKRKSKYGLTKEKEKSFLDVQNGKCPGCLQELGVVFHVDHCHATGRIRGLTCGKCNASMGLANDDFEILKRLSNYLEKHYVSHC